MSQGTRCHQLALYVVLESPLNMLCDSPTNYEKEPSFAKLLASIPTTWDETRVLCGEVGEYIVTARRKGNSWYVGGITNWTSREVEIDLSELMAGGKAKVDIYRDGLNAHRKGSDYRVEKMSAPLGSMTMRLERGGGFFIRIMN